MLKRLFDLIVSGTLLVLFLPMMAVIAYAVLISMGQPILLRQDRPGRHGQAFVFYKFRSMTDARDESGQLLPDADRLTQLGRKLRSSSLDELPQLFNVLIGNMSLVGPRPHLPEEVAKYSRHHRFVLTIKPGITGMAQVSGRSDLNFEDEVRLDTYYIEHWSLWLDIKIIFKTFTVVLARNHQE